MTRWYRLVSSKMTRRSRSRAINGVIWEDADARGRHGRRKAYKKADEISRGVKVYLADAGDDPGGSGSFDQKYFRQTTLSRVISKLHTGVFAGSVGDENRINPVCLFSLM